MVRIQAFRSIYTALFPPGLIITIPACSFDDTPSVLVPPTGAFSLSSRATEQFLEVRQNDHVNLWELGVEILPLRIGVRSVNTTVT